MWKRPAVPASSKERCEAWDGFTVPRFARVRHFHGPSARRDPSASIYWSRRTPVPADNFDNIAVNMAQTLAAARQCLDDRRILPCLTLIYAGMDVMASLEARPKEGVKTGFTRWVDTYLLPNTTWQCGAIDLYAARCAVVHSFTPESDLSRDGKATVIYYAHSGADESKLQEVNKDFNVNAVCLEVSDLLVKFDEAILAYLAEVEVDRARKAAVRRKKRVSGRQYRGRCN